MSTNVGSIHYDLSLDTSKFDSAANKISDRTKEIGDKMQSVGKKMSVAITLPIVAGFGLAVKSASDLNETLNKVDVAFGNQANTVKQWSSTSIKSMGLAKASALDAAALFGDMSTSMGLSTDEAAKMSMSLVQLGADLASFKNISFGEAQTALAGVFTGETESLKRLGIVMTETNLQAYALAKGISKPIQEMTQAEKVQLRFAYIMDVTKNAQGDFTRTSSGTANQIRQTQERFKELSATIGQQLLPITNQLLEKVQGLLNWFSGLSPQMQKFILITLAVAAVIGPLVFILGSLVTAISAVSTAFLFLAANPIVLIIAAIIVAIAAMLIWWDKIPVAVQVLLAVMMPFITLPVVIIKNWSTLVQWFGSFKNFVVGVFSGAGGWLYDAGRNIVQGLINGIKDMVGRVKEVASGIANAVKDKVKGLLGIHSPSRVFKGFGQNIVEGLAQGINSNVSIAGNAAGNLASSVMPSQTINNTSTASVSVNMSGMMARSRSDVRDMARDMIQALNEELRAKGVKEIGVV